MFKKLLILFLFSFFFSENIFATHNRAGEITYRHISGTTYEATVTTYTRLPLGSIPDRTDITILWGDGDSTVAPRANGNGTLVDTDIKMNIYIAQHSYKSNFTYTISVEDPNRNADIVNIPNSVEVSFYLQATLYINPLLGPNNSPTLSNPPIDNACTGNCFEHNPGAFDVDGDSLSYELTTPFANGAPIAGYTLPNVNGGGSLTLDVLTGDLSWCVPTKIGEYNVAILIHEWRKFGNKYYEMGTTLRDMQITVAPCSNNPPVINPVKDTCVMAGSNLNFVVTATDPNNNTITLTATGGPLQINPKATFTSTPTIGTVNGTFSWTPNCNQIRQQPYQVTFKATDNGNPNLVSFETMWITVIAPPITGLIATPGGGNIVLNWNPNNCNQSSGNTVTGYLIYRKNSCDPLIVSNCQTGVLSTSGYTLIGSTTGINSTTFTDLSGLSLGTDYSYIVVTVFSDGSLSYASTNVCTRLVRDLPIITNVDVTSTNSTTGTIDVKWIKPLVSATDLDTIARPGPYEFRVLRATGFTSNSFTQVASFTSTFFGTLNTTTFADAGLNTVANPYKYKIEFYYNGGTLLGSTSDASSVYLTLTPNDNQMGLTWEEHVPWTNYQYVIYRQNLSTFVFDSIGVSTLQTYVDTGLLNKVTYCYKVKSLGQYSDTSIQKPLINFSQEVCAAPMDKTAPCAPTLNISSDCDNFQNLFNWTNPNSSCSDDVVTYKIYYAPTETDPLQLLTTITLSTDTHFVYENFASIAGCFAVTAIDTSENESSLSNIVCIDNCPVYELPNVFTPNNDGSNDLFGPFPYKYVKDIDIKIFDRWGVLMFETIDPDINWNGTSKQSNKPCPDGVYFYVCVVNEIKLSGIVPRELKGFIHLIRGNPGSGNK